MFLDNKNILNDIRPETVGFLSILAGFILSLYFLYKTKKKNKTQQHEINKLLQELQQVNKESDDERMNFSARIKILEDDIHKKRQEESNIHREYDLNSEMEITNAILEETVFLLEEEVLEEKSLEAKLIQDKEFLEKANKKILYLIEDMSNEIRNPVNNIIELTELAVMKGLNDEQRDYLSMVRKYAALLLQTVNNVLKYASGEIEGMENLKCTKILLAEDDEVNCILMKNILEKWGLSTDVARNGVEAFELFKSGKYDLVIMDVQMPVLDGVSATRKIREWEKENGKVSCAIVALTGYALKGDKENFLDAGMDDYVSKPINIQQFKGIVEKYLNLVRDSLHNRERDEY